MNSNAPLRVMHVDMPHFAALCTTRARVTHVQDFVTECWDGYSVCYVGDYITLKVMNASR